MAATSSRTLRLLSLLQNHRYWPGGELAGRLEVSVRTLRRDIDRLRELGYPVLAHRGVAGGYQLEAGAALPPLLLDDEEAVALAVALRAAAQESVAGVAESSVRALAKLTQVMPARLRHRIEALRTATDVPTWPSASAVLADPMALVAIALACRDGERLRFGYSAAGGVRSDRHVEPLRLVPLGRRWYLVAYDLDRSDWRSFRLDRMDQPQATGSRFRIRELPGGDAVAFVLSGIDQVKSLLDVEVLIDAPAEAVRARLGRWATVEQTSPNHCRMTMHAESLDWPAMALGSLGVPFEVVRPPELTGLLRAWADLFQRSVGPKSAAPGRP